MIEMILMTSRFFIAAERDRFTVWVGAHRSLCHAIAWIFTALCLVAML